MAEATETNSPLTAEVAEPNGCQHCGIARRAHFQHWRPAVGWHTWTAPSQQQIKERMRARREAALAAPKDGA